jgi:hypothetical protein
MSGQQRAAISQAVSRAVGTGAGPQEMARTFRGSIGLTANQEAYVNSYRRQLETLNSRALDRALRDRRFDARFSRALERDRPLTPVQIDTMVDRYRARALAMRAETIGRTEALTAYSQAREESLRQMISQTGLSPNRVMRVWHSIHDDRVRAWHADMEGERRPVDEPFVDGLGNPLMYPGDPPARPRRGSTAGARRVRGPAARLTCARRGFRYDFIQRGVGLWTANSSKARSARSTPPSGSCSAGASSAARRTRQGEWVDHYDLQGDHIPEFVMLEGRATSC